MDKKCQVYLYTGEGAGKTTASLGLALRSIGHGHKVVIVQFLKGRKNIGEWKVKSKLKGYYDIHQFGRPQLVDPKHLQKKDYDLARKGIEFAKNILKKKPDLLILDEANLAAKGGLISIEDIFDLIAAADKKTVIVLTGRYAPKELIEIADFVNEIKDVKHPMRAGIPARKGIQY